MKVYFVPAAICVILSLAGGCAPKPEDTAPKYTKEQIHELAMQHFKSAGPGNTSPATKPAGQ